MKTKLISTLIPLTAFLFISNLAWSETDYTDEQVKTLEAMSKLGYDPFDDAAPDEKPQQPGNAYLERFGIDLSVLADLSPQVANTVDSDEEVTGEAKIFLVGQKKGNGGGDNVIRISLARNTLTYKDISTRISHGTDRYPTPTGSFAVQSHDSMHLSEKWSIWNKAHTKIIKKVYMPYSLFFVGGVAMHQGSPNVSSHGCIHVPAPIAAELYRRAPNGTPVIVR